MWRRRAFKWSVVQMLTGLLLLCVVHSYDLTLNHRRQQHRRHLRSHSCQKGKRGTSQREGRPGLRALGLVKDLRRGALTVGCGRVSVPMISPKEHVEGEIRNVVALFTEDRGTT